jgi:hypothetical protein
MPESTFEFLFVFLFAVLPCAVAGYYISIKQNRGLISGWDDSKYTDPQRAATVVGNILMLLSIIIFIFTILYGIELVPKFFVNYFVMVVIILPIGSLVYVNKKYGVK